MNVLHFSKLLFTLTKHILLVFMVSFMFGSSMVKADEHGHAAHDDHEKHESHREEDKDHSDHEDHDGHADHGEELELSSAQKKEMNLQFQKAGPGNLQNELSIPGEVVLNEDTLVHLVSRVPGIVVRVMKTIGDQVKKGEVIAILDSAELGEAKAEYFEIFNEVGCCRIDLERARIVAENTKMLLADLEKSPLLDELRKKDYGDMGAYRASLLSSYAEYIISKKAFERKKELLKEKIASERQYLETQNAFEKAESEFYTAQDNARFEIRQNLLERERTQRVVEFKLKTAERKLQLLGLTESQIKALQKKQTTSTTAPGQCTDPNCKDCQAEGNNHHEGEEHGIGFSEIEIKAPSTGTIIEKHITHGEKISDETEIFAIADLSTVWAKLKVAARDLEIVRKGMSVIIESEAGIKTEGDVSLISPVVDEETRTSVVRVVLANPRGYWRPGIFITGHVRISAKNLPLVVPRIAIQNIENKNVVFIATGDGFKPVPVQTGRSDGKNVEIISGLKPGTKYVTQGAFELKAIMITSSLGAHAGHGH